MATLFNILALLSVCATAAMDWFGIQSSLYWTYVWWDIPTHMLGGLTVGLWAAAVASRWKLPPRRALFFLLGLALAVGVAWEIWEAYEGVAGGWGGYWFDTIKDVCDDLIGSLLAWLLYRMLYLKQKHA